MPNSIYDQLNQGLVQAGRTGQRSVLYRGKTILCTVLVGDTSTALGQGGLQDRQTVHILIPTQLIPFGQDGDPHTNETVLYPAVLTDGLTPRSLMIHEAVPLEWCWALTLIDPSQ